MTTRIRFDVIASLIRYELVDTLGPVAPVDIEMAVGASKAEQLIAAELILKRTDPDAWEQMRAVRERLLARW